MRDISKNMQAVESFNRIVDSAFHKGVDCRDVLIASDAFDIGYVCGLKNKENERN